MPTDALPIAVGRVSFIRQVTAHGRIYLLGLKFTVGPHIQTIFIEDRGGDAETADGTNSPKASAFSVPSLRPLRCDGTKPLCIFNACS
jgi:hypothetical protein